jgi:hypothetical protein
MIKILSISLAVCIVLLLLSLKMVMVYHEESVVAQTNVTTLTQSLRDANHAVQDSKDSCKATDTIVNDVVNKNKNLNDSTSVLLDNLERISPNYSPAVKEVKVEKVIFSDKLSPAMFSLLQQSYCETSGDTSSCPAVSAVK